MIIKLGDIIYPTFTGHAGKLSSTGKLLLACGRRRPVSVLIGLNDGTLTGKLEEKSDDWAPD